MNVLELRAVSHRYGQPLALQPVDLTLAAGQSLGLIGPDGVGKSTLLGLIAGVKRLQHGQLQVLGADFSQAAQRRATAPRIAYMPQGLGKNLYPTLSVWENLEFFARLFGHNPQERIRRGQALLQATQLWEFRQRPAAKLSGGMKQKLGLCCALIHDPELLILDEPTTGVDPLSRRQFWQLIAQIRAQRPQMSLLVATAYMEEAEPLDQIIAMDAGQILAHASAAQLKQQTAATSLEQAFIRLLPEQRRRDHIEFNLAPRATDSATVAIEAQHLSCRFGDFTAVDGVSFRIEQGEIFGFLGSNGCGKTTTMKMLTGLLAPTSGSAQLFGHAVDAHDLATRRRVGFMSQAFSLYGELTVQQNLELHARLFQLPAAQRHSRITELCQRFGLHEVLSETAERLPLGIRQRLSLAVAVIHQPELLILDEPTSGVDPVARDGFWQLLLELSRQQGVTIFISTHFMNEAQRCDRLSLMHAGKVLAQGSPSELQQHAQADSLEAAFIHYLEAASPEAASADTTPAVASSAHALQPPSFSLQRLWAYALRESLELARDRIRLSFALFGTLFLLVVFGFGISFDVEHLPYALLDHDQTPESRWYAEHFSGSRYFTQVATLYDSQQREQALQAGTARLVVEIPPGFGRDLQAGRQPELAVWVDGAMPFRGETTRGYVDGLNQRFIVDWVLQQTGTVLPAPATIATRLRYNQDFRSVNAMVPGVIMLLLALIPAMLTAVGVVREKELGSILNLYATPVTRLEFLLGKQLPYIALAAFNALSMLILAVVLFQVPIKGDSLAFFSGALLYVCATTGFGLLISTFVQTQVAALFAAAILSILPAVNFSGLIVPVASLNGAAQLIGMGFPSVYFQRISIGVLTKGLDFSELWPQHLALAGFALLFIALSSALLRKQER